MSRLRRWFYNHKQRYGWGNIILEIIAIFVAIVGTVRLFVSIVNSDIKAFIYVVLLFLYVYGSIYMLWDMIFSKSRKLNIELEDNKNNPELVLRRFEYISICRCIAQIIKELSGMIIIFMVNIVLDATTVSQSVPENMSVLTHILIAYLIVVFSIMAIIKGFFSTDVMILFNTDSFIEKKVKKLSQKYRKEKVVLTK